MNSHYKNQVALLLSILPEVAKEKDLAVHGGTAINLFVRNMPRLSVDIDLTYIPVRDRTTSLLAIRNFKYNRISCSESTGTGKNRLEIKRS